MTGFLISKAGAHAWYPRFGIGEPKVCRHSIP